MSRGPTIHVPMDAPPWIETEDGRRIDLNSPEGRAYAEACGVRQVEIDPGPIGNTPPQDHHSDPYVMDPRPIRRLTPQEVAVIRFFVRAGAYAAVAGFETWRARDRWYYVDILGVGKDADEAEAKGMPVGPIEEDWIDKLRMVGTQLAMRVLDPNGRKAGRSAYR